MSKVEIKTELLEALNKSIAGKEESFTLINKASTEEKISDVKPKEIVGETFNAKDWMGEPGDESESTIAGCFNTIVKEMADFVEGVILVDSENSEDDGDDDGGHHYSGPTYSDPDTPTDDTPTEDVFFPCLIKPAYKEPGVHHPFKTRICCTEKELLLTQK